MSEPSSDTATTDELLAYLAGRRILLSVSGGKDSMAAGLWLRSMGFEFDMLHADTGWEHPDTVRYVRETIPEVFGRPVHVVSLDLSAKLTRAQIEKAERLEAMLWRGEAGPVPESPMIRLCLLKGMFPGRTRRFCTQQLKIYPMRDYVEALDYEPVQVIGIRHAESKARSTMPEWDWSDTFDCELWRPLIRWTFDDVIDCHKRHGVAPNPLYLRGSERVGCWPCIYARKKEIDHISRSDINRIAVVRALEAAVTEEAAARHAAKGEATKTPPTWFQDPVSRKVATGEWGCHGCKARWWPIVREERLVSALSSNVTVTESTHPNAPDGAEEAQHHAEGCKGAAPYVRTTRGGKCWPIDAVIEWAQTARGGRQHELFAPDFAAEGCMRWGMCE